MNDHEFKILRKYMAAFYAELRFRESESNEFKLTYIKSIVPQFFARVRKFRNVSLEKISKHSGLSEQEVQDYEHGKEIRNADVLSRSYCHTCGAHREIEYFTELVEEFKNPSVRENKRNIANDFRKKTGLQFQTIRYDILDNSTNEIIFLKNQLANRKELNLEK